MKKRRPTGTAVADHPMRSAAVAAFTSLLAGLFPNGSALAQSVEIVSRDRPVAVTGPERAFVEPHVAVHPSDADRILIGTIAAEPDGERAWHCSVLSSSDGGESWRRHDFEMESCIDPWVLFPGDGSALATMIEIGRDGPAQERFRLWRHRSADGGTVWTDPPVSLGAAHDHEILVPVPGTGGDGSERLVYLGSRRAARTADGRPRHALYLALSRDAARSFRPVYHAVLDDLTKNVVGVAAFRDTSVAMVYWEYQRDVDGFRRDGMLRAARVWLMRSEDGGLSFGPPSLATETCASGVKGHFPGYPAVTADTTVGPFGGRVYVACVRPGLQGIGVVRSTDGGRAWSVPVRVDGGPADGTEHARTPMIAVGPQGIVAVAWYDRRDDPDRECQHLYLTASTDGGVTFGPPARISSALSCPANGANGWIARSWPMGGDYGSLAAAPDGTFRVVWADARDGLFELRTAVVRVER